MALIYIRQRYPKARLLGLGFSIGANVLTRYIAEEGDYCRLAAACVLACVSVVYAMMYASDQTSPQPWDLLKNSEAWVLVGLPGARILG